ncbi:hypothetical protein OAP63_16200 [Vibrio sp.]|nr:hypothetical protein [Vibrio sp.]
MKKVLLITVPMGGYETALIKTLESKGFKVDFFKQAAKVNKSELSLFQRGMRGINRHSSYITNIETKIYEEYIQQLDGHYDYIFDFGGKARHTCLSLLRKKYPKAKYLLYMWDDIKHSEYIQNNLPLYDDVFVFNHEEAQQFGFRYRPNFYIDDYIYDGEDKTIDVFYRGTLREKQRTRILDAIEKELSNYRVEISLHARGGYLKNFQKVHSKDYFDKKCDSGYLNVRQLSDKYKHSNVLIDIAFDNQIGLGLRPLEAIAANCKLITTNPNIVNYDFFNPQNIFILYSDSRNISGLIEFMDTPLQAYSADVRYKYSVSGFIDDVFGLH